MRYRNACEELTIRAKEQAERCQLDRVEALVQQAAEAGRRMKAYMQELQQGIAVGLAELEKFESKWDCVFVLVMVVAVLLYCSCCY
jgi:gamma-glutamyl:cysteine ligase YbdK (ATP-grasp superfamily)